MTLGELTDEEVREAPVEHLALMVLERFAGSADLNFGNFMYSPDLTERSYGAKSALAEAWNWLERKGLRGRTSVRAQSGEVSLGQDNALSMKASRLWPASALPSGST